MRAFAKELGYENASFISDVLNEKRRPNSKLLNGLLTFFNLGPLDEAHLRSLIEIDLEVLQSKGEDSKNIKKVLNILEDRITIGKNDQLNKKSLIVKTVIEFIKGGASFEELEARLGSFISVPEIQLELDVLIDTELVSVKNGLYFAKDSKAFLLCGNQQSIINRLIERVAEAPGKKPAFRDISFYAGKKEYKEVRKILNDAFQNICLVATRAEGNKDISVQQRLFMIQTAVLTLDGEEEWD